MKKILIIEDDDSFANQLKASLSRDYTVEICPDGQSGFYAIYELKPDAVLLDLTIEHMDAVSLVGKMRVQKQFQRLPIFVLADSRTVALADDALAAGANAAFLKDDEGSIPSLVATVCDVLKPAFARRAIKLEQSASIPVMPITAAPVAARTGPPAPAHDDASAAAYGLTLDLAPEDLTQAVYSIAPRALHPVAGSPAPVGESGTAIVSRFLESYGAKAHELRKDFIRFRTTSGESDRTIHFESFLSNLSSLNAQAVESNCYGLSRFLVALEARLKQLVTQMHSIPASSLQILASALDALVALDNHLSEIVPLNNITPLAMVVDDDSVSRKALCLGLEKSGMKGSPVENPEAAILEAESKPFDIIFLDVDLPKMNGFALCARLRIIPSHRKTPILFVTALNDVKSRASSRVSGGNQFLTKPLNMPELGANAWTLVIRKRILDDANKLLRQRP